jgi:hypothetical protein
MLYKKIQTLELSTCACRSFEAVFRKHQAEAPSAWQIDSGSVGSNDEYHYDFDN